MYENLDALESRRKDGIPIGIKTLLEEVKHLLSFISTWYFRKSC
jgi:hypothetical protein